MQCGLARSHRRADGSCAARVAQGVCREVVAPVRRSRHLRRQHRRPGCRAFSRSIPREAWEEALNESLLPLVDLSPRRAAAHAGRQVGPDHLRDHGRREDRSAEHGAVGFAASCHGGSREVAVDRVRRTRASRQLPVPRSLSRPTGWKISSSPAWKSRGLDRAAAEKLWLEEVPLGKFGSPEDFGAMVAMLASERAGFITGTAIALDGGKSRAY